MKTAIEKAIRLATAAAAERPLTVIGGAKAKLAEITAARHASNFGQQEDRWIILFGIDWHDLPAHPDALVAHVDSETESVTFRPGF